MKHPIGRIWLGPRWTLLAAAALLSGCPLGHDAPPPWHSEALLTVERDASVIAVTLPPTAHAQAPDGDPQRLQLLDAQDRPVPFALVDAVTEPPPVNAVAPTALPALRRDLPLYPLPPAASSGGEVATHLELRLEGGRLRVQGSLASPPGGSSSTATASTSSSASTAAPPGWLIDLGPALAQQAQHPADRPTYPPLQALELRWPAGLEFTADYRLSSSADLRQWQPRGGGQLLALSGQGPALRLDRIALPAATGIPLDGHRYLRLDWVDAASAPRLIGAQALLRPPPPTLAAAAILLERAPLAQPLPEPAPTSPPARRHTPPTPQAAPGQRLEYELGGALPLQRLDLRLPPSQRLLLLQ
jgi:hypothetical protein